MTKKQKMQRELQDWFDEQNTFARCISDEILVEKLRKDLDRLDFAWEYCHACRYDGWNRTCETCEFRETEAKTRVVIAALEALGEKW